MNTTELLYVLAELDQKTTRYMQAIARRDEVLSWPLDMGGRGENLRAADLALRHEKKWLALALEESRGLIATAVRPTANVPATAGEIRD